MDRRMTILVLLAVASIGALSAAIAVGIIRTRPDAAAAEEEYDLAFCQPLVIAHRGASGYIPEHTLGAYALAATMGSDYLEPDVVMTKDGVIIARHDNELGLTTDVAQHPEFADRYRTQTVDAKVVSGWFTEDFTLAEIKTLRSIERIPKTRPGNARMDTAMDVPTMQEIIDLTKGLEVSLGRPIGIYPEIKHGTHFQRLGLAMEKPLVDLLHNNGYRDAKSHIYIQSFEVNNLKELKNMTDLRLIQLFAGNSSGQPFDQVVEGTTLTYAQMATAEGLREIATYAYAVGPDKRYIIPRNDEDKLGTVTSFVQDAHAAGLKVHPYTFRSENEFLPAEFRSDDPSPDALGDAEGELRAFLATGIDGLFTDQPDDLVRIKNCD
ncbi:glycerophosphodiester phosphodiesterase GDPD6-like [Helicoverpa zea]|uniref:glycerophosphodiester phosphodiesterase GDPD6-like n=1 Tax=Helicoverpa zea TaxID=7113 RepID=UPI001F57492A|nr:glycerophosphodiester phosphodiesterase GDPD6-like [Helicoverpa zea]XP_047038065.1 glycerophosphodiester phosphodiesterase GDPD6-like [Helicoverpa zea]XP_047038075.1 glycerophosphodiester phosphodiesterase GDPD6-like [Helicoverpa zea]